MAGETRVTCIADVRAVLGEGPVWLGGEESLYWVDIKGRRIFCLRGGNLREWRTPYRIGSLAPHSEGGFIGGTD